MFAVRSFYILNVVTLSIFYFICKYHKAYRKKTFIISSLVHEIIYQINPQ